MNTDIEIKTPDNLLSALSETLKSYLSESPSRTLNGLSKKCTVSEPTLRRILKGQIKTLPTSTTILDILTTLTGEKNTALIAKRFPGPIADYLFSVIPIHEDTGTEYDPELNNYLKDAVTYLIYKLSSNSSGLTQKKITELFGKHGLMKAEDLIKKDYLYLSNQTYFSKVKHFTLNQENFVTNFKLIADFIKTQKNLTKSNLQSILANYSESISVEAFKEIANLQKKSLEKIRNILSDEKSKGTIPVFLLVALDTLDSLAVQDIVSEDKKLNYVNN